MLTGENGILTQAQRAKNETANAQKEEESVLENYEQYIEGTTNGGTLTTVTGNETENTKVQDGLGNTVWVPAGFRVVNPGDNVEDGIVIEDVSHKETKGSQFVWIPVGQKIKKKDGTTFDVKLSRYTFDTDGFLTDQGSNVIDSYFQELTTSTYANTIAKDIEEFKTSATSNGGYYIGRYEARDGTTDSARTSSTSAENQITVKANDYVYNYVIQAQAAKLSREMYIDTNFTSDLMNSYAWDTAIVFLQKCDDREENNNTPYSRQISLNNTIADKGTNNEEIKDKICNIFDMASNFREWTTETYSDDSYPCVRRGGRYGYTPDCTVSRNYSYASVSYGDSFRPLLYLEN